MDFTNNIEHPYHAKYNWLIERYTNGCDEAEGEIRSLCYDIRAYDLLHSECIQVVKDYDEQR